MAASTSPRLRQKNTTCARAELSDEQRRQAAVSAVAMVEATLRRER